MTPAAPSVPPVPFCASCGEPVLGQFCGQCGAPAQAGTCAACQTPLSPGARHCHRCGYESGGPAVPGRSRRGWIAAASVGVVALLIVAWWLVQGTRAPVVPDMGNAGNVGLTAAPGTGAAPDISQMSPLERFIRLNDRIMAAAAQGDTATANSFTPMALGAYAQLDTVTIDARYHGAILRASTGDWAGALALADTIHLVAPDNLFAFVVRGTVAELQGDTAASRTAYQAFLKAFPAQIGTNRPEYVDHRDILDQFRSTAAAAVAR